MLKQSGSIAVLLAGLSCGRVEEEPRTPPSVAAAPGPESLVRTARPQGWTQTEQASGARSALTETSAEEPLIGVFEQVDNRQAIIIIRDALLVETNLEIPVPRGNGSRVSPKFPHALRPTAQSGWYSTMGYYNDGQRVFNNVELRVSLYDDQRLLDVSLVVPVGVETPSEPQPGSPPPPDNPPPSYPLPLPRFPRPFPRPFPRVADLQAEPQVEPECFVFPFPCRWPHHRPRPMPQPTPTPTPTPTPLYYQYRFERR